MPRQSRSRPAARPAAPAPQKRTASTAAAPPAPAPAPPAPVPHAGAADAAKPPGMLAQMAATAGSVAIGSTIGHGLSSMLFGGGASAAAEPAAAAAPPVQQQQQAPGISCEVQARDFTKCLEAADVQTCAYYLEQLKACQAAARPY